MNGVHQGFSRPIFVIEPVEIIAYDLKSGNTPRGILDSDSRQVATMAE